MSKTQQPPYQRPYYHEDIDFTALATEDEDFAALIRQNDGRIDWQDPSAIQYATHHTINSQERGKKKLTPSPDN